MSTVNRGGMRKVYIFFQKYNIEHWIELRISYFADCVRLETSDIDALAFLRK